MFSCSSRLVFGLHFEISNVQSFSDHSRHKLRVIRQNLHRKLLHFANNQFHNTIINFIVGYFGTTIFRSPRLMLLGIGMLTRTTTAAVPILAGIHAGNLADVNLRRRLRKHCSSRFRWFAYHIAKSNHKSRTVKVNFMIFCEKSIYADR